MRIISPIRLTDAVFYQNCLPLYVVSFGIALKPHFLFSLTGLNTAKYVFEEGEMSVERYGVIDFHSHILPGIDDGSPDVSTSIAMLQEMKKQGVAHCVATPHFYRYRRSVDTFASQREAAWQQLSSALTADLPRVHLGAEVALFSELSELSDEELSPLCIAGTRTMLLEMPFAQWRDFEVDAVARLSIDREIQVVLAHLERYLPLQQKSTCLDRILSLPVWIQINAESLTGGLGNLRQRRQILQLFERGQAHLLGSDCHNLSHRAPNLQQGREALQKHLGAAFLSQMDDLGASLLSQEAIKL